MDKIPELQLSNKVINDFKDEELVEIVNTDKIEIKMMYPILNMKNGFNKCLLRKTVANMLYKASDSLPNGYKFLIWDSWRPFALQKELFEVYSKDIIKIFHIEDMDKEEQIKFISQYVADPIKDEEYPPAHTTGGAIDLTLTKDGKELDFGTGFDSFSDKTNTTWFENHNEDSVIKDNRRFLYYTMINVGFTNLPSEWWHYEYGDQNYAKITGNKAIYKGIFEYNK